MRDPWHIWRVSHVYRFAICCTPRCGSQSSMTWFARVHKNESQLFTDGEWLTSQQRTLAASDFYTLALTRDPWSRLVSAYLGKIVKHQKLNAAKDMIQNVRDLLGQSVPLDEGITFRQFVYASRMVADDHWRPTLDFITINPTRSCTPANLRAELTRLAQHCQFTDIDLPEENRAKYGPVVNEAFDMMPREIRAMDAYPRWDSFYDDALRSEVERRYTRDIERFGLRWDRAMADLAILGGADAAPEDAP